MKPSLECMLSPYNRVFSKHSTTNTTQGHSALLLCASELFSLALCLRVARINSLPFHSALFFVFAAPMRILGARTCAFELELELALSSGCSFVIVNGHCSEVKARALSSRPSGAGNNSFEAAACVLLACAQTRPPFARIA